MSGRASGLQKLTNKELAWLSVWSEVQIICNRSDDAITTPSSFDH